MVPSEGIYRGVYNIIRDSGDTLNSGVVYLALWESSLTFQVVGDSLTGIPANHSGSYLVDDATKMHFWSNTAVSPPNNANHYLDTTYNYVFTGDSLAFWYQEDTTRYDYNLIRN
ncbi:MAG: hypothetical protein ABJG68_10535 [Crocinitomicaceae bacterium]